MEAGKPPHDCLPAGVKIPGRLHLGQGAGSVGVGARLLIGAALYGRAEGAGVPEPVQGDYDAYFSAPLGSGGVGHAAGPTGAGLQASRPAAYQQRLMQAAQCQTL